MDRRRFLKLSGSGVAVAVVTPSMLFLTGCSLKGTAQEVLDTLKAIYNADPTAVWAADLNIAIQDMATAIADWNGSSMNCELQSAATIAGSILDSIPLGLTIDLMISVALAGIDALLNDIAPCTTTSVALRALSKEYTVSIRRKTAVYQTYLSQFTATSKSKLGEKIKASFNSAAKASGVAASI